jgi:hypothetical protein
MIGLVLPVISGYKGPTRFISELLGSYSPWVFTVDDDISRSSMHDK